MKAKRYVVSTEVAGTLRSRDDEMCLTLADTFIVLSLGCWQDAALLLVQMLADAPALANELGELLDALGEC